MSISATSISPPLSLSPSRSGEIPAPIDTSSVAGIDEDRAEFSEDGLKAASENEVGAADDTEEAEENASATEGKDEEELPGELTEEELEMVQKLKDRDREVRTHEQAHLSVAGELARGGAQFEYQRGPDGKRYAIGGHVNIEVSPDKEPEQTIAKAERIKRAALAPAEPSSKDRQVASKAEGMRAKAVKELQAEQREAQAEAEASNDTSSDSGIGKSGESDSFSFFDEDESNVASPFETTRSTTSASKTTGSSSAFDTDSSSSPSRFGNPGAQAGVFGPRPINTGSTSSAYNLFGQSTEDSNRGTSFSLIA